MKNKKIIALTVVGIIGITTLIGCKSGEIKRQLESGITALNDGKYDEAKEDFEEVIREDKNNGQAQNIITIIDNYENAKKALEQNKISEVKEYISKIPKEYTNYSIKDDIDKIKGEVDKKDKIIKDIDAKLQNIDSLIKDKKYEEAQNEADKIDIKDAFKEQKDKLNNYNKIINKKLEEIRNKEIEEKVKKEMEEAKAKKNMLEKNKENKKTVQTNKDRKNNNQSISTISYSNKQLGLQLQMPAVLKNHYEAFSDEMGKSLSIEFITDNGESGNIFYIEQYDGAEEIANIPYYKNMYENIHYKTIGGKKYIVGIQNFKTIMPNNPQYKVYLEAKSQAGIIESSIRSIK
ncbi:MAG: hypothetical protein RR144_05955 [Clostridia bacterium]